jgi:hypothetical protein
MQSVIKPQELAVLAQSAVQVGLSVLAVEFSAHFGSGDKLTGWISPPG